MIKGYVVTLMQLPESVDVATRCQQSGKEYNVDVEIVPAVHKSTVRDEMAAEGLQEATIETEKKFLPPYTRNESSREAVFGNFMTQYRIWDKIVNSNEPGIVLEHDAVFVAPVPDLSNKGDIINIGKPSYGGFKTPKSAGVHAFFSKPGGYFPGAHGYYLTPTGAKRLIEMAKKNGVSPCDLFLNKKAFPDLKELYPWVVEAHDSFTTIQNEVGCKAKHNYKNNKNYKLLSD